MTFALAGGTAMPLHDWSDDRGWDSVHFLWLGQLLDWMQPRLPAGQRAYVGAVPAVTLATPNGRPDMSVRQWSPDTTPPSSGAPTAGGETAAVEPDAEMVATFTMDEQRAVHVDFHGQLI